MKQAVLAIQSFLRQPKATLAVDNLFAAPDRAVAAMIRTRAEQIDAARRYWACPF